MRPTFLFVGLGKTGSSLMHNVIRRHPGVFLSSRAKELNFFSDPEKFARGEAFYDEMFEGYAGQAAIGDISPGYYSKSQNIDRILDFYGEALPRIILSVRHPVVQFYSRYVQVLKIGKYLKTGSVPGSFSEEFRRGQIFKNPQRQIREVFERLGGAENILLLVYEQDFTGSYGFERKIYDFLGLDSSRRHYSTATDSAINAGLLPRIIPPQDSRRTLEAEGRRMEIPGRTAYFLSTENRSRAFRPKHQPQYDTIAGHHARQEDWRQPIEPEIIERINAEHVIPIREFLESRFGVDLSCWDSFTLPEYGLAPLMPPTPPAERRQRHDRSQKERSPNDG